MKKTNNLLCPVCGEQALQLIIEMEKQNYKGHFEELEFHYAECSECGTQTAGPDQLRFNKRQMIKFQKRVDGLLSSEEIKLIRKDLHLTVKQAGEIFGGGPVAFSKYENDELIQSLPMDAALVLAKNSPESVFKLAEKRGVKLNLHLNQQKNEEPTSFKVKSPFIDISVLKVIHAQIASTLSFKIPNIDLDHEVSSYVKQ